MTAVEIALDELEEVCSNDEWAERIVEFAAFRHLAKSPSCTGYTMFSAGRSACFAENCGWAISGRLEDAGERRSARFAMEALGTIGVAITMAEEAKGDEIANRIFSWT